MNKRKREQNEAEFDFWNELEGGGRMYWFEILGRSGGKARYVKTTDKEEVTISFVQEIYDMSDKLIEIHEKYPVDKGHKKVSP